MEKVYIIRKVRYYYNENSSDVSSDARSNLIESIVGWDDDARFAVFKHFMGAVEAAKRMFGNLEYVHLTKLMPAGSIGSDYAMMFNGDDSVDILATYETYDFDLTITITIKEVEVMDD